MKHIILFLIFFCEKINDDLSDLKPFARILLTPFKFIKNIIQIIFIPYYILSYLYYINIGLYFYDIIDLYFLAVQSVIKNNKK